MAREWTPEQSSAINTRDRTLLVSAAAGSGKTATLTERIIRTLLEDEGASLSDMLIVTFTNAAVAELKERIRGALTEAVRKSGGDKRLERELLLLPAAHISTIDAFCAELLRQNAERVGVSPSFRIADPAEAALLFDNILDALLSSVYEGELPEVATPAEIDRLADCLTDMKNREATGAAITYVYTRAMNTELGVGSLAALVERYREGAEGAVEGGVYGKYIIDRLHSAARHHLSVLRSVRERLSGYDAKANAHRDTVDGDIDFLEGLLRAERYEDIRSALRSRTHGKTPNKLKDPAFPPLKEIRLRLGDEIESLTSRFFSYDSDTWRATSGELYSTLSVLYRFISKLDEAYRAEKNARGMCEYSDIERYAYDCLWQGGELTDIAYSQRKMYRYVYIDEYQDVNSLQARIFEAVTPEGAGFMVGDIKQSIYGFRNANPAFFKEKKTSFPPLSESVAGGEASIFMSNNFRSDEGVIDFVNLVFDTLFEKIGESMGYEAGDRLRYSKKTETPPTYRPAVLVAVDAPPRTAEDPDPELYDQPTVVARKIKELLECGLLDDGTPVKPRDIAILLRSAEGKDKEYAAALTAYGIPSALADEKSFFCNPEVLLMISLLSVIDNPRRDTELLGIMCSPIFNFTPDELVQIRREGEGEYFYDALLSYNGAHPEYERGHAFVARLSHYRAIAEGMPTDALIARLFGECRLLPLAAANGGTGHLLRFYDYARRFEGGSFEGLYNFISYITRIMDKKKNAFETKEAPTATNAVRIQTVHSSKGLEYPIVFLAGAEKSFRSSGADRERLTYDEGFGIGLLLRTPGGLSLVDNPMKRAIRDYIDRRELEEETRILYVALTRARERLYVIGKPRKRVDNLKAEMEIEREFLDTHSVYSLSSSLEAIMASTGKSPISPEELYALDEKTPHASAAAGEVARESEGGDDADEIYRRMKESLDFKYPREHMTELPEKLSISRLYPTVLDGTEEDYTEEVEPERERAGQGKLPSFITGRDERESARRGIATHMLLQFCDLERLKENGAAAELERLLNEGYLSARDGERVRIGEIEAFRRSELFGAMLGAKRLHRELRFNVMLDADDFTTDPDRKEAYRGESVLVQGVIDCIIEGEDGSLRLVDYKTDRMTREELADESLAEAKLRAAHSLQLSYYAKAIEKMLGRAPTKIEVYSLALGRSVTIL
ncbi:MAG: UvrD-helicase domain-containing protein [Clostridia bacterium]|nr:UvrD-helicase domain-containing protein [Clostridia bacterium]